MKSNSNRIINLLYRRLLPVQILLTAIQSINGIVDGLIGSRLLGPDAMAAVGLYSPLLSILCAIACVIAVGAQVLGSHYVGKGNKDATNQIFSITLILITIIGIVVSIALICFRIPIALLLKGNNGNTLLSDYMCGVAVSFLFDSLCMVFSDYLQILGDVKKTYIAMGVLIVSNSSLNVIFIKVLGMGIFGLGLATTVSTILTCLVMSWGFLKDEYSIHFTMKKLPWKDTLRILKFGSSSATFNLVLAIKGIVINYIVLYVGGEIALAAMSADNSICGLIGAISVGVGTTTLTMGSVFYGEEDRGLINSLFKAAIKYGLGLALIVCLVLTIFAGPISYAFFGNSPETMAILKDIILISSWYIPVNVIITIITKMYHLQGKMVITNILSSSDVVTITIFSLVFGLAFGIKGIWFAMPLGCGIILIAMFVSIWIHNKRISFKTSDILMLSDSFGVSEDKSLYVDFTDDRTRKEAVEELKIFLKGGIPDEKIEIIDAAIAKISSRILENNDSRKLVINLSCLELQDSFVMRIRDNGSQNDLTKDQDSLCKVFGADEITYKNYLGLNVLNINYNK